MNKTNRNRNRKELKRRRKSRESKPHDFKKLDSTKEDPKSELTLKSLVKSALTTGIPSSFSVGDYYLLLLTTKIMISSTGNTQLLACSAYFTAYFSLLLHAINLGTVETQGILGSQAYGRKEYKRTNLFLRQALLLETFLFAFLTVLPSFFFSGFLRKYVIEEDNHTKIGLAEKSQKMIMMALPGMFLRLINDNIKVFIQNQDESLIKKLGLRNMGLYALSIPLGYFVIIYLRVEESSLGIIIFIYEAISLLICWRIIKTDIHEQSKDTSLPVLQEFGYFARQSTKNFLVDYPSFLAVDGENIVASLAGGNNLTDGKAQISIHSLFFNIGSVSYTFFIGFLVLMRTTVNHKIGEKKYKQARDYFLKYERLIIGIQVFAFIVLCLTHWCILRPFAVYEDNRVLYWADKVYLLYFFNSVDLGIEALYNNIIRTFQKQNLLVWLQFGHFIEIGISWYLAVKLGMGVVGIGIALCVRQIIIQIVKRLVIFKSEWEHIKEYVNEKSLPVSKEAKEEETGHDMNQIEMTHRETEIEEDIDEDSFEI